MAKAINDKCSSTVRRKHLRTEVWIRRIMNVGFKFVNTSVLHGFNRCGGCNLQLFVYRTAMLNRVCVTHTHTHTSHVCFINQLQTTNSSAIFDKHHVIRSPRPSSHHHTTVLRFIIAVRYIKCFISL